MPGPPAAPAGVHASEGGIAAGGDVTGSSTHYITADQAFVLPPEAYAPIPDDAADRGVSNIAAGLFVGRADELLALEEAFTRPGKVIVHAVHGLGGVGKSALAAHWAGRRSEKLRWWVTADDAAAVDAGLAALARALQPGLTGLPAELQGAWRKPHHCRSAGNHQPHSRMPPNLRTLSESLQVSEGVRSCTAKTASRLRSPVDQVSGRHLFTLLRAAALHEHASGKLVSTPPIPAKGSLGRCIRHAPHEHRRDKARALQS